MYVVDELKLNKFQPVHIPSCKALFARFGFTAAKGQNYSGEGLAIPSGRKIDDIAQADALNEAKIKAETSQE